jgi:hypothetical protein
MDFIRGRLCWEGQVNRSDLIEMFGVSPNQATADLRRFEASNPGALAYDPRAKTYRAGPSLGLPTESEAQALLRELRLIAEGIIIPADGHLGSPPILGVAEAPPRSVEPTTLVLVLAAIRESRMLQARYTSFSSSEPRLRRLEPHALVFDGFRWHARARDADENRFKDFVLGRLKNVALGGPKDAVARVDSEWESLVEITIVANPKLKPHQKRAVELDYGMSGGELRLKCRKAVEFYLKRRLGLIPGHENLAPNDQQIVLQQVLLLG